MAVKVDKEKCIGCGACVASCSDCFKIGDDGKAEVIKQECKSCDLKEVAGVCPVGAIEVK